ncbi:MAG: hypothetical protein QOF80_2590 [Verrucomicrobiota bacterium]|jgi:hypothetical protein
MYHLATIGLRELDEQTRPVGDASGCIVRYRNAHFFLTVRHATENQGNWAMEIEFDPHKKQPLLYQLGGMGFLKVFRLKKGKIKFSRDMDFSYKLLPAPFPFPQPRFQILSESGTITRDEPKLILESDLSLLPDPNEEYGFWGLNREGYNTYALRLAERLETSMRYKGTKNHLHLFETQAPFTTYKRYQGCSGAPILDSHGRLVSLVVEGNKTNTGIYGFPLDAIRPALDVELWQAGR